MLEQRLVGGVPGGEGEPRQEVPLLEVELAQTRRPARVGEHLGMVREERPHLRLGLDVRFLPGEAEPLGIVQVAPGADRQQHVVRLGVLPPEVVGVVGGDHAETQLLPSRSMPSVTTRSSAMPCCWTSSQNPSLPKVCANHSALFRASS